ncbi:hypothetical protein [Lacticaseibacillus sp. N501-2]|uniref:hypothetical protein n=1 Tax=Lacticaseibacillus salsurae TaxID=3367729 RepID=UPI0038B260F5
MTEKSWLDSPESMRAYAFELVQHPWTVEDNLNAINELRALSGDRPLSLARYLENRENLKRGIYSWDDPVPKGFFHRLSHALKQSKTAFVKAMKKH